MRCTLSNILAILSSSYTGRLHIDPNEQNWFLRHRNTFGNPRLIAFILFFHWCIWLLIVIITSIISRDLSRIAITGPGIISIICDFIIYLKYPKFDDAFAISNEIKSTVLIEIFGMTLFYILFVVVNADFYTIEYAFVSVVGSVTFFGIMINTLYYPLHKFKYPTIACKARAFVIRESSERGLSTEMPQNQNADQNLSMCFQKLMASSDGFNAFARHLTKEFCVENLLFFVETQQWLLYLTRLSAYREFLLDQSDTDLIHVKLHPTCPKSKILGNDDSSSGGGSLMKRKSLKAVLSPKRNATYSMTISLDDLDPSLTDRRDKISFTDEVDTPTMEECIQCSRLYRKFVSTDAYFCINVRYAVRHTLSKMFGYSGRSTIVSSTGSDEEIEEMAQHLLKSKISKEQLFHMFDDARLSIYRLLLQSVTRFRKTSEYVKLQDFINKDHHVIV